MNRLKEWTFIKASRKGSCRVIRRLLPRVANNPDCLMAALQTAVDHNKMRVVEILLKANAPIDGYNDQGFAAIHFAADQANQFMISLLLDYGASINLPTQTGGDTPLHLVVGAKNQNPSPELQILAATMLINRGADVNIQNNYRNTPLHDTVWRACRNGSSPNLPAARLLIDSQANVLLVNNYNHTPLSWAHLHGVTMMIPALREADEMAKAAVQAVSAAATAA